MALPEFPHGDSQNLELFDALAAWLQEIRGGEKKQEKRDEEDRRRVVLRITEAGREQAEAASSEEKGQNLYEALSVEEQDTLKALLKKLLESWNTRD